MSAILKYIDKALSPNNRTDDEINCRHRVRIEFAEVGPSPGGDPGFWFNVTIPRQVNNELGYSISEQAASRHEAAVFLRYIADMIDNG